MTELIPNSLHYQIFLVGRIAIAMILGGLIGLERELVDKPAGLRTHMLVAGAACLFVGLADVLVASFADVAGTGVMRTDPIRIVEAIITGISFLGAGTIFTRGRGGAVEGLTTAASILLAAAVGISVALSQYVLAVGVTLMALVVLKLAAQITRRLHRR